MVGEFDVADTYGLDGTAILILGLGQYRQNRDHTYVKAAWFYSEPDSRNKGVNLLLPLGEEFILSTHVDEPGPMTS